MRYSQISEPFTTVVFLDEVEFLQHLQNKRADLVVQQTAHSPQVFIFLRLLETLLKTVLPSFWDGCISELAELEAKLAFSYSVPLSLLTSAAFCPLHLSPLSVVCLWQDLVLFCCTKIPPQRLR